jgi:hypothetical protein
MKDQTGTQRAVAVSPSRGEDGGCRGGGGEEMGSLLSDHSLPTNDTPSAKQPRSRARVRAGRMTGMSSGLFLRGSKEGRPAWVEEMLINPT